MVVTKFQNVSYDADNIFVKDIYQIFQYFYDPLYLHGKMSITFYHRYSRLERYQ